MAIDDDKVALVAVTLGHLAFERDRGAYLQRLVELCAQAVDADRCTIYGLDRERDEVRSLIAQRSGVEIRLALGRGFAGSVAATGETINVPNAYADPRFDRSIDLLTGYRTVNMLAVPVWSADGRTVVGVLQVLNRRSGVFERSDQMLLERIALSVAPVLERIATRA